MRRIVFAVGLGLVGCVASPAAEEDQDHTSERASFIQRAGGIPDDYIVVLRPDANVGAIDRLAGAHRGAIHRRYAAALRGFAARMSEADARELAREPEVLLVEQNGV